MHSVVMTIHHIQFSCWWLLGGSDAGFNWNLAGMVDLSSFTFLSTAEVLIDEVLTAGKVLLWEPLNPLVPNTSVSDCPETLALSRFSLALEYFRRSDGLDSAACSTLVSFLGTITDTTSDLLKNEVVGVAWIFFKFLLGVVIAGMLNELTVAVFDTTFGAVTAEIPSVQNVLGFVPISEICLRGVLGVVLLAILSYRKEENRIDYPVAWEDVAINIQYTQNKVVKSKRWNSM